MGSERGTRRRALSAGVNAYAGRKPRLFARKRHSEKIRVAFRCRADDALLDAAVLREGRWCDLERLLFDRRFPGANDLTVDYDDRPEHAAAAGQLLVLSRDDRAAVPMYATVYSSKGGSR